MKWGVACAGSWNWRKRTRLSAATKSTRTPKRASDGSLESRSRSFAVTIVKTRKGPQGLAALKSYARKFTKRKQLEEQVEKLKVECAALAPAVLRYFEKHGIDRQTVDGYTVAPRYELWA